MGKSNRIRNDRANASLAGVKAPKKNNGMPSWALNLITIVVTVAILFSVVFMLMTSNGVFGRMSTAMRSDNFRVSRNMMDYYFQTQYNNFVSQNSSYLSYYGLDTSLSLKDQYFDTTEGSETTWFDYMMDQTKVQVEEILIYCEEAKERGIELDEEDYEAIDTELETYETYAEMYGYDTNSYIAQIYGKGMKLKDIRAAMELSSLASKCSEEIGVKLESDITDDDIKERYDSDSQKFNNVDYSYYTFTVSFEDAVVEVLGKDHKEEDVETNKADIIAKYKEMIEDAKEKAAALLTADGADAFKNSVVTELVSDAWDDNYETSLESSEVKEGDELSPENTATVKAIVVGNLVKLIIDEGEFKSEDVVSDDGKLFGASIEGVTFSEEYATLLEEVASTVFTSAQSKSATYFVEKATYTDSDDAIEWAFEDDRKAGDTKTIEEGDGADGAEMSEDPDELESFSVSAYYLVKPEYKDESLSKNVGLMVFTSSSDAAAAVEKLSADMSIEEFEALCDELGATFSKYENYTKGSMGVDAFDTWLYDEETVVGSYTDSAISLDETTFAVAIYYDDGMPMWEVSVKSAIFSDKYEEFDTALTEKYKDAIKTNDKAINKIDA